MELSSKILSDITVYMKYARYNHELNSYIKGDPILLYIKRNNSSRFVGLEIN